MASFKQSTVEPLDFISCIVSKATVIRVSKYPNFEILHSRQLIRLEIRNHIRPTPHQPTFNNTSVMSDHNKVAPDLCKPQIAIPR